MIKLTGSVSGKGVYINPSQVVMVLHADEDEASIFLHGNSTPDADCTVKETPAAVAALIEGALSKVAEA